VLLARDRVAPGIVDHPRVTEQFPEWVNAARAKNDALTRPGFPNRVSRWAVLSFWQPRYEARRGHANARLRRASSTKDDASPATRTRPRTIRQIRHGPANPDVRPQVAGSRISAGVRWPIGIEHPLRSCASPRAMPCHPPRME
jgi:hypothetical protein